MSAEIVRFPSLARQAPRRRVSTPDEPTPAEQLAWLMAEAPHVAAVIASLIDRSVVRVKLERVTP